MAEDSASGLDLAERNDAATSAASFLPLAPFGLLGRLTRARLPKPPKTIEATATPGAANAILKRRRVLLTSFCVFVLAPAFAVALYLLALASDQFEAETRFAVRSSSSESIADKIKSALSSSSGSGSISGSSLGAASQDAYIAATYIRSRAVIDDVTKTIDLREVFRRPEADFWARLRKDASAEELAKYWNSMVTAKVEATSGIVTVRVRAFRPEDALAIANAIIRGSEALANEISLRARTDAMKLAEREVGDAERRVLSTLEDLRKFRDQVGFIDPKLQATSTGAMLTGLLEQRINLQGNYFVAERAMSPEAPSVQALKMRLEGLDRQIEEQEAKLTGKSADAGTIASLLPRFDELELRNRFAEKLYDLTQDSLERARQRAEAQNIYVSVFVPPAMPEDAKYPERWTLSAFVAAALFVFWGIGGLTAAAVQDHRI